MRKLTFTFLLLFSTALTFAQATYYWVGGENGSWSSSNSWSATLGGEGGARATPANLDVLIFDGSNIGKGATGAITTQPATPQTIGRLVLQNNADVTFARTSTGATTLTIGGDGTPVPDLLISAGSKLNISGNVGNMILVLQTNATGSNAGTLTVEGTGRDNEGNKLAIKTEEGLVFENGSQAYVNSSTNSFSTVGTGTTSSVNKGVIFNAGSKLFFQGGPNPFGSSNASSAIIMNPGSNLILEASLSGIFGNSTSPRAFGNIFVTKSASVTGGGSTNYIENITIDAGSTFTLHTSGGVPVHGNIVNNGSLVSTASNNLILLGPAPQTLSGTGSYNVANITIGTDATVTLQASLSLNGTSTSSIIGGLNLGTHTISGSANISSKEQNSKNNTATLSANGITVTLDPAAYPEANVSVGASVTGTGIQPGTYIIATASSTSQFTINKPATLTGASTITITTNAPTMSTANPGGIDGSITTTGSRSYSASSNYIFNAATSTPFNAGSSNGAKTVTINAPVKTNRSITINGALILNSAKFSIPAEYNVSATSLAGSFGTTSYIATESNTNTGEIGKFRINGISTETLIPLGTPNNYLPVNLIPQSASDFALGVFEGITGNGSPNGTPLPEDAKKAIVNVVWDISRPNGTGECSLTLNWPGSLEGSDFSNFSNSEIGIAQHNGSEWGIFSGFGNNTLNSASIRLSSFSPLSVGKVNTTLPIHLVSFNVEANSLDIALTWKALEVNASHYVVEHSSNGKVFNSLTTVQAKNGQVNSYSFKHQNPEISDNYYRLIMVDKDGTSKTSPVISTKFKGLNSFAAFPNPAVNILNINGLNPGDIIKLMDLKGAVVINKATSGESNSYLDVQNISPGNYILTIENKGKIITRSKVIKL